MCKEGVSLKDLVLFSLAGFQLSSGRYAYIYRYIYIVCVCVCVCWLSRCVRRVFR